MIQNLSIALPAGKSLEAQTLRLLRDGMMDVPRPHARLCTAPITGFPHLTRAAFFHPVEIPTVVADQTVTLGITGGDIMEESRHGWSDVEVCTRLPFSRDGDVGMRVVLFTKNDNPIGGVNEVENDASIATEYPVLTAQALSKHRISKARVVECRGSSETSVVMGRCRYGVGIVASGETLSANGLHEVQTLAEIPVVLIARHHVYADDETRALIHYFGRTLQGVLEARTKVYLLMNVPKDKVDGVQRILPSLRSPTREPLLDEKFVALGSVVQKLAVNDLRFRLEQLGAEGFVTLAPSTVM